MAKRQYPSDIRLRASIDITAAADGKKLPSFKMVAYTGGVMRIPGWPSPIVIGLAGLTIPAQSLPILRDHDPSKIVGHATVAKERGRLVAYGTVSATTAAALEFVSSAKNGFPWQASIGASAVEGKVTFVGKGKEVRANGKTFKAERRGLYYVQEAELREISVVAAGADSATEVNVAAKQTGTQDSLENIMENNENNTVDEIRAEAAAESKRIAAIRKACKGDFPDIEAKAIEEGWDVTRTELEVIRAERPKAPNAIIPDHKGATGDVLAAACLSCWGHGDLAAKTYGERVAQRGEDLRCRSLVDLAASCLAAEGRPVPRGTSSVIQAGFSTMSLPVALGSSAEKLMLAAYADSPQSWRSFAKIVSVSNFRSKSLLRPTFLRAADPVGRTGLLTHTSVTEEVVSIKAETYGQVLSVSRQDIYDDDAGVFVEAAIQLGKNCGRALNDLIWRIVLLNDGDFFHGDNGNYMSGGTSALGVESLAAAIAAMLNQRDVSGRSIDIRPKVLCVSPSLEMEARQLLVSSSMARYTSDELDNRPQGNPFADLQLLVEPRIENKSLIETASGKTWVLFAGSGDSPVAVAFLDARETPTLESFGLSAEVGALQFSWRGYFDFGVAMVDPRAAVLSVGE